MTECPECRVQMGATGTALRAHYLCSRCGWEVIVDDGGKVFRGRDASDRYVKWLNEPDNIATEELELDADDDA